MGTRLLPIPAAGLYNSVGERRVALSQCWRMSNCTVERDKFEVAPRHGAFASALQGVTNLSGGGGVPSAVTTAYSLHYGAYLTLSEYVVIAKVDAESNATAFVVNTSSGNWFQIDHGDADNALHASTWYSAQYRGWMYFVNPNSTKMYKRKIGSTGTVDENWMEWNPSLRSLEAQSTTASAFDPPYSTTEIDSTSTFYSISSNSVAIVDAARNYARIVNNATSSGKQTSRGVVTVPSGIDLSTADTLHILIESRGVQLTSVKNSAETYFCISEDASGIPNQTFVNTLSKLRYWMEGKLLTQGNASVPSVWIYHLLLDLSDIAPASRNSVRRFVFSMYEANALASPFAWELRYDIDLIGGGRMWETYWADDEESTTGPQQNKLGITDVKNDPLGIEYAYAYYVPSASPIIYVDANKITLGPNTIQGDYVPTDTFWDADPINPTTPIFPRPNMGCAVLITAAADATRNAAGYTRVAFFRRRPAAGAFPLNFSPDIMFDGKWVRIDDGTVTNTGTPTWTDRESWSMLRWAVEPAIDDEVITFEGVFESTAENISVWKNHLVVAADRKLYFSFEGDTNSFMPDPEGTLPAYIPAPGDYTAGRTVYLSDDRAESCQAMAPREVFYAVGDRGAVSMAGDNAFLATRPRRLNNSRGAISKRGAISWKDGVLVAAYDGLWYFQDARPGTDVDPIATELTVSVRDDWRRIIGVEGDWADLILIEWEDEIWVFNETTLDEDLAVSGGPYYRYLRLTRPQPGQRNERRIETGATPTKVVGAHAVAGKGMKVLFTTGKLVRWVRSASGIKYTTDDGSAVAWTYQTGREPVAFATRVTAVKVYGSGTPDITIDIYREGGSSSPTSLSPTHVADTVWEKNVTILPGHEIQVTVAGSDTESVDAIIFVVEDDEAGFGA